jgi:hypothetical protein
MDGNLYDLPTLSYVGMGCMPNLIELSTNNILYPGVQSNQTNVISPQRGIYRLGQWYITLDEKNEIFVEDRGDDSVGLDEYLGVSMTSKFHGF